MRQQYQLGGQQQDISQKNTIQPQLIGDFFEKFHFSLVDARLAGKLVERIKIGRQRKFLRFEKDSRKNAPTIGHSMLIKIVLSVDKFCANSTVNTLNA